MSDLCMYVRTALSTGKVFVSLSVSTMELLVLQPLLHFFFLHELVSFRAVSTIIASFFKWKFQWINLDFHSQRVMFFDDNESCVDVVQPDTSQNSNVRRYRMQHYVLNGAVYMLQDNEVLRRFHVGAQTWESFTAPHDLGICCSVVPMDADIFFVGGLESFCRSAGATTKMFKFCTLTSVWIEMPRMRTPRYCHAVVGSRGILYVTGGRGKYRETYKEYRSVESWDSALKRWNACRSLHQARCNHTSTFLGDMLLIVGGSTARNNIDQDFHSDVEQLSRYQLSRPRPTPWQQLAPLSIGRDEHAALACNGHLLVYGGGYCYGHRYDIHEFDIYDQRAHVWSFLDPTAERIWQPQCIGHGGRLYIFGGNTFDVEQNEEYTFRATPHNVTSNCTVFDPEDAARATVFETSFARGLRDFVQEVWPSGQFAVVSDWCVASECA